MSTVEWEAQLRSRRTADRLAAARRLAASPHEHHDLLLRALDDRSNLVVGAAAHGLAALHSVEAIGPLMERYWWFAEAGTARDSGCVARIAIVPALVACRATEAAGVFFHAIKTTQPERSGNGMEDMAVPLRAQAAVALAELRLPGALLALSLLLFDSEPCVPHVPEDRPYITMAARIAAARALPVLGEPGAVAVLGVRLAHGEGEIAEVLVECMDAVAALDPEATLQLVEPYLYKRDAYLVASAATCLAGLPRRVHHMVLPALAKACGEAVPEAHEPVALAIASVRSDEANEFLRGLVDHPEARVRLAGVAALEQRGDAGAVEALRALASRSGDRSVAARARQALRRLGV